jgi:hypothetical protein
VDRATLGKFCPITSVSPATYPFHYCARIITIYYAWTYGIEICGCASKSHLAKMQGNLSKILRMITNAPWYVTNQSLHDDLKVTFIKDVIQEKSINYHDKLGNHSNPVLQSLLEQQQRRLKKLAADPIDG